MSTQFSGTVIRDSIAMVDSAMQSDIDPAMFLASVKTHLAEPNRSKRYPSSAANNTGDRAAYVICHDIQECLFSGREVPTYLVCFCCGVPTAVYAKGDILEYMRKNFLCATCDGD